MTPGGLGGLFLIWRPAAPRATRAVPAPYPLRDHPGFTRTVICSGPQRQLKFRTGTGNATGEPGTRGPDEGPGPAIAQGEPANQPAALPAGFPTMKHMKPYLGTAFVVLIVYAIFAGFLTPLAPASLQKFLPK